MTIEKPRVPGKHDKQCQSLKKSFTFDHVYGTASTDAACSTSSQLYQELGAKLVDKAFEGYNRCIFAYGQTEPGKTFTMMGTRQDEGFIPLACKDLFRRTPLVEDDTQCRIDVP